MGTMIIEALAGVAAQKRAEFRPGANLRIRGGRTVHRARMQAWVGPLQLPGPDCGTGFSGCDPGAVEATADAVTCAKCRQKGVPARESTNAPMLPIFM